MTRRAPVLVTGVPRSGTLPGLLVVDHEELAVVERVTASTRAPLAELRLRG